MKRKSGWRNGKWFSRGREKSVIVHARRDIKKNLGETSCGSPEWSGIQGAMPKEDK